MSKPMGPNGTHTDTDDGLLTSGCNLEVYKREVQTNGVETGKTVKDTGDSKNPVSDGRGTPSASTKVQGEIPPIAIVGMGMRLPGGVKSAESFWELLVQKKDGRCVVPGDRFNIEAFQSSSGKHGTIKSQHGYFLQDANLQHLDASFFSMNKTEVERLDPQQRILLEVVWECMENAGQVGWRGKNIGCYVGVFGEDWLDLSTKDTQNLGMYRITGSADFVLANRVSYEYNLGGPSVTVRTACSSSLVGLHEACQAILHGDCESAIVAGTNLIITPTMTIGMTEQGVLSPTGSCKSFDAKADGYARGEGINAVYIKRLSDALRDGDPIRAVIRSTATNCDGRTAGMANPSSESHESMIRRAYRIANLDDVSQTAFVECHATGTAIGDPLEAAAIANVFGRQGVFIGSVKPNVGHTEGASGATSLIKAVLALEHKIIPPNINFSEPNPKIPFGKAKLQVPVEPTPWPTNRQERVSVNSFGIGGANAHVIVDSASSFVPTPSPRVYRSSVRSKYHLLVFSANHPESLRRSIQTHLQYASANPAGLADLAYTLGARRQHLGHRAICVTNGEHPAEISPFSRPRATPRLHFVFTGQGAQWTDELRKPEHSSRLNKAEYSQPLCTAIQIGLLKTFHSIGILPAAVVGHSSGEIAAAFASKAITARAAIIAAYYRGKITRQQNRPGGMVAVAMGREMVTPFLTKGVVIACENSPASVTLSGDRCSLNEVTDAIKAAHPNMFVRTLKVEMAYHSSHMEEIGGAYEKLLQGHVSSIAPTIPFFSSVTGKHLMGSKALSESYWRRNLESPVLFNTAVQEMLQVFPHDSVFLEIGPHSALAGPLREIFKSTDRQANLSYVSTLVRGKNSSQTLLETMGNLYMQAIRFDFGMVTPGNRVLTELGTYPWHHDKQYWNETRVTREWRFRKFPPHELLGSRILEGNDLEPTWRNILRLEDVPWIEDHKIANDIIFPAAGYIGMVGEAIKQAKDTAEFSLRRFVIKTALVLQDAVPVEMMTSLRPVRLTTFLDSAWYEFSVSSHNGTSWTIHCVGQVKVGTDQTGKLKQVGEFARKIPSAGWYGALKRLGYNYGPDFQGLGGITACPKSGSAAASLIDRYRNCDMTYQLHPTTIDLCLQLFTVAMSKGVARQMTKLCVPTSIEELQVNHGAANIQVEAMAQSTKHGSISGNAFALADGQRVLQLGGVKFSPLDNGNPSEDLDTVAGAYLHWKPDLDLAPTDQLMRQRISHKESRIRLEKLALLCILETRHRIASIETPISHLQKLRSWLDMQVSRIRIGEYGHLHDAQQFVELDRGMRLERIDQLSNEIKQSGGAEISEVMLRLLCHCEHIFEGSTESIDVLLQDGGLWNIYKYCQEVWDCSRFFELLGHATPTLKVLEIGAGTGGTTASVLKDLVGPSGARMYSRYDYTDISAGFFVAAKERFKDYQNINYSVLDITQDPTDQGFDSGSYDLIIASNVLHATPSIGITLRHVRKLLRPQGRLFLQELTPQVRMINFIMGFLQGWWLGEKDGRPDEPFITVDRWDGELRRAGFSGADLIAYDDDQPWQINANIVSYAIEEESEKKVTSTKEVTLICEGSMSSTVLEVKGVLEKNGFQVRLSSIDLDPPATGDVISLLDLTAPFFDDISEQRLLSLQRYFGGMGTAGMLWVTKSSQVGCSNPRYSQVVGVARTVRSELLTHFATLELDSVSLSSIEAICHVFRKFQRRTRGGEIDSDFEYALVDGVVQIPRYHWISTGQQLETIPKDKLPMKLEIAKFGLLQSLRWVQDKAFSLDGDQVEVEPRAIGLNFKDVLVCMGVVQGAVEGLGLEASGIVRKIGPNVKGLRPGDRVFMFEYGSFSTRIVTSANHVARIPDELSFEEAATMPCVYGTVIYSLMTIGRLEKDQIFATVGSEDKIQYLTSTEGIPRDHIFSSRDSSFYHDVMRKTDGKGVDVVLNSLSGELLHVSWQCVAEFGKMLEIGKRDFIGSGTLSMDAFEKDRAFFGIDIGHIAVAKPVLSQKLLCECVRLYQQGFIGPIKPMKMFEATHVADAFRYLQKGQHIGKIVVTMPAKHRELQPTPMKEELHLQPDKSYLLTGGLGGLGRAISTWLVERGARNLIYLSRFAGKSEEDKHFFNELAAQDCSVQAFPCSVTNLEDVKHAVKNATAPIVGVMHMSMVLKVISASSSYLNTTDHQSFQDRPLLQFSHEEWQTAVSPKVAGSWNLHEALTGENLDFFVLFSSFSGVVGQWGQGNYAAANTFLDSFAQYRHGLGLPASVVDIGVMEDTGYVSQNSLVLDQFKATSTYTLREPDLLEALQLVIARGSRSTPSSAGYMNPAQLVIGLRSTKPLSDPSNRIIWKRDIRMSMYRNSEISSTTASNTENQGLKQFLADVASEPSILNSEAGLDFLTHQIGCKLYAFMLQPEEDVDVKVSLTALGVDSLLAIEIRNWCRQSLGLEMSILEIMSSATIEGFGKTVAERLHQKYEAALPRENGDTPLLMKAEERRLVN
ncbi:MAG: hypothetical protein Q9157_006247 [Trypethelium eluteriae]